MADRKNMKIVDLRKELTARGLSTAGDKAELLRRLQASMSLINTDEHCLNLDSDIDSDVVLQDENDKSPRDHSSVALLNGFLVSAEPPAKSTPKPRRILHRRKLVLPDVKTGDDTSAKKPKRVFNNLPVYTLNGLLESAEPLAKSTTKPGRIRRKRKLPNMVETGMKRACLKQLTATAGSTTRMTVEPA